MEKKEDFMKKSKERHQIASNRGITLVALVVTIIVLLILAGVSLSLITGSDKKEKSLVKEDFAQFDNDEITVVSVEDFPVQVICEDYKFEIDENFVVTYVEKFSLKYKLRNKWNLGEENPELMTYQGTTDYQGTSEGVYLYNSVLASKENYILNDTYTIIIETKNIENNGCGFMVGIGEGGGFVGERYLGIYRWVDTHYWAHTGAGDGYAIFANSVNYPQDQWNISAIKYDGTEFSYFVNGQKMGESNASNIKDSRLYIGGISNSGTSSAGVYWGYGNGYYRNLAIYDEALSDEDLENYSF